jgi:cysteine desulfurase/selenocysteine lyase
MIYLDNAATTFPKPEAVYAAMDRFLRSSCANPGRSGHRMAMASQKVVAQCRQAVAELLGAPSPERVVFTMNATEAINIGLKGTLKPGDHVITTGMEHNAAARPLNRLAESGVAITFVPASADGVVDAEAVCAEIRPETRMIAMTHASNVVGTIQPVEQIGEAVRGTSVLLLVDAAQTAGAMPMNAAELGIDLLAFAGHKGLLGPPGTGGLVIGERADPEPLREGGTGTKSEQPVHPTGLPERLEAGTVNVSGLAGLLEGVRYLTERGVDAVRCHERELGERLFEGLSAVDGVALYGPASFERRVGVVSFNIEGMEPADVAAILDTSFDIATRPGLHCAPLAHECLGTYPLGSVRMSVGPFTTEEDIDAAVDAVGQIAASA